MTSKRIARTLDLSAFRDGVDAGLASVAAQAASQCEASPAPVIGGTAPMAALPLVSSAVTAPSARRPVDPYRQRLSVRPTRRTYFRFAAWACGRATRPLLGDVAALWTQGNASLAQEWLDDLYMALSTPAPDDDTPPCIAEKFSDIAHDIHRSAQELDQ